MAWTAAKIPDQSGAVAVVTGANGGLGLGLVAEGAVPSAVVVVLLPVADHHARLRQ
jgi:NAD(P)-dependent dehydrogenase (short-subunit alcohol dehydrogenase family)